MFAVGTVAYLIYQGGNELFNTDIHVTAPQGIETEENGKYVVYNGETYKFNDKVTNVLCMGIDKRNLDEDNNSKVKASGGQADVLMLVSIDTSNGKITLLTFPEMRWLMSQCIPQAVRMQERKNSRFVFHMHTVTVRNQAVKIR